MLNLACTVLSSALHMNQKRKRKYDAGSSKRHKTDEDIEERQFREKMFDAMGEDERLDGLETQFNDFAHVPDRWRRSDLGYEGDDYLKMDPNAMDDEEYAEWIRIGMYRYVYRLSTLAPTITSYCRKTHAEEYAKQQRKKAERAARKADEKARKAETKRLAMLEEDKRKRQEDEGNIRQLETAREEYNSRWIALLASGREGGDLAFHDIPWPVIDAYRRRRMDRRLKVEDFTAKAISWFLFGSEPSDGREKLREAIRRFHPDKFEGRFMQRLKKEEQERVLEGIAQVARILLTMTIDSKGKSRQI